MSVDFLLNKKKEEDSSKGKETNNSSSQPKQVYNGALEWSDPKKDYYKMEDKLKELDKTKTKTKKEGSGIFSFFDKKGKKKDDQSLDSLHFSDGDKNKARISKSREELLKLISSKEQEKKNKETEDNKKVSGGSLFSFLFGTKRKTSIAPSPIKKEASIYNEIKKSGLEKPVGSDGLKDSVSFSKSEVFAPATTVSLPNSVKTEVASTASIKSAQMPVKKAGLFGSFFGSTSSRSTPARTMSVQNIAEAEKARSLRLESEKREKEEANKEKEKRKEEIEILKKVANKDSAPKVVPMQNISTQTRTESAPVKPIFGALPKDKVLPNLSSQKLPVAPVLGNPAIKKDKPIMSLPGKKSWWDNFIDYWFSPTKKKVKRIIPRSQVNANTKSVVLQKSTANTQSTTQDILRKKKEDDLILAKKNKAQETVLLEKQKKETEVRLKHEQEEKAKKEQEEKVRMQGLEEQKKKLELEKVAKMKIEQEKLAKELARRSELEKLAKEKEKKIEAQRRIEKIRIEEKEKEAKRIQAEKEEREARIKLEKEAQERKVRDVARLKLEKEEKEKREKERLKKIKTAKKSFGLSFWLERLFSDPVVDNKKPVEKPEEVKISKETKNKETEDKKEKEKNVEELYSVDVVFSEKSENHSAGRYLLVREIERRAKILKSQPDLREFRSDKYIKHGAFLVSVKSVKVESLKKELLLPNEVISVSCKKILSEDEFGDLARRTEIDDDLSIVAEDDKIDNSIKASSKSGNGRSIFSSLLSWFGFDNRYETDEERFAREHLERLKRAEELRNKAKKTDEPKAEKIEKVEIIKEKEVVKPKKEEFKEELKIEKEEVKPEPKVEIEIIKKDAEKPKIELPEPVKPKIDLEKDEKDELISQDFLLSEDNLAKTEEFVKSPIMAVKDEVVEVDKIEKEKTTKFSGTRFSFRDLLNRVSQTILATLKQEHKDTAKQDYKMSDGAIQHTSVSDRWKATKTIKTNLIQDATVVVFDWRRNLKFLNQMIMLAVVMIACVYGFLKWFEMQKEKEGREFAKKLEVLNSQIKSAEKDVMEIADFKKRLSMVNGLLDNHVYWTNLFRFLEKNTLSDVYYLGLAGDTSGSYILKVKANNYSSIDAQVEHLLSNKYVFKVTVDEGRQDVSLVQKKEGGKIVKEEVTSVAFDLNIVLDRRIFTDPSLFE